MTINAIDLTTLSAVRTRAEVVSTSDDAEIQAAITAFSRYLLNYTGRATLNSVETLSETYDGNGNTRLFLRSNPILTLTSVILNGSVTPISTGVGSWGAYIEQSKKSIGMRGGIGNFSTFPYPPVRGRWPCFIYGQGNVEVVYTAGFAATPVVNEINTIAAQTITLQQGPWASDAGVKFYPSFTALALVPSAPTTGQYAVSGGVYVFASADNSKQVAVSYGINQAPFDLEYAVRCVVALNYKRKGWQDQASRAVSSQGASATTRYRDWAWPPEIDKVFDLYSRQSII